jgi:hypothetical protein
MIYSSWNCCGALRNKLHEVQMIGADVIVVQECEDPARTANEQYRLWASNYLWVGRNKNRGLGVFAKPHIRLSAADLDPGSLQSFLPCWIDNSVFLLAVWTQQANSPTFQYIGQMWKYLQVHGKSLPPESTLVVGDFNSNTRWDKWDRWWNHSDVVRDLSQIGLHSVYHYCRGVDQGHEVDPTFFLHRKPDRAYHIDYAFAPRSWLSRCTIEVGKPADWLPHSDHMPLTLTVLLDDA